MWWMDIKNKLPSFWVRVLFVLSGILMLFLPENQSILNGCFAIYFGVLSGILSVLALRRDRRIRAKEERKKD